MSIVNIFEAKTNLSKLVTRAEQGEEIIIARNGKPAARLAPLRPVKKPIVFGLLKGKIHVPDDFDAPLPEDVLAEFEADIFPPARSSSTSRVSKEHGRKAQTR